jgi:hypothetical protein
VPLNQNAKKAIQRLQNDFGVTLDPVDDYDILVQLNDLGTQCECPFDPDERKHLLSLPIRCGDVDIHRPTFGALFWIEDYVGPFFADEPLIADVAVLFALAHARRPEVFDMLSEREAARSAVKKWAKSSNITVEQAESVLLEMFPDKDTPDSKPSSMAGFIEVLMNTYPGSSMEYWLWEQPIDRIEVILDQAAERASDEAQDNKKAPNPYAPSTKALKKIRNIISETVASRGN